MKRKAFFGLACLAVALAYSSPLLGWDEEILNGHYSYEGKKLSISFDWRLSGIKNLRINSRNYDEHQVSLEKFGDIECYQIRVAENTKEAKIIRIVFLLRKENVEFVSGYFADLKHMSEDGDSRVSSVSAIVLRHTKFGKAE